MTACYATDAVTTPTEAAVQELHFEAGLPGFPGHRRFVCTKYGGAESPFVVLAAQGRDEVQFVVVAPEVFFPGYTPAVTSDSLAAIGLEDPAAALVWVIITLGPPPQGPTANLLGPLVINPSSGQALQAVQAQGDWSAAAPLPLGEHA